MKGKSAKKGAVKKAAAATKKKAGKKVSAAVKKIKSKLSPSEDADNGLEKLLFDEMKDILGAEKQLTKALPKMAKKATSPQLKKAFEDHLKVTEGQIKRLEKAFAAVNQKVSSKKCKAMEGLIKEGEELMKEIDKGMALDAALICAAQKVEHYEMATYGCIRTYARLLGETKAAELFQQTLDEEGQADKDLTTLAESFINERASRESAD